MGVVLAVLLLCLVPAPPPPPRYSTALLPPPMRKKNCWNTGNKEEIPLAFSAAARSISITSQHSSSAHGTALKISSISIAFSHLTGEEAGGGDEGKEAKKDFCWLAWPSKRRMSVLVSLFLCLFFASCFFFSLSLSRTHAQSLLPPLGTH